MPTTRTTAACILGALSLAACGEEQSSLFVNFRFPEATLSVEPDGRVALDGSFVFHAYLPAGQPIEETEAWLDRLDVTTVVDSSLAFVTDLRVPDGASLFPVNVDARTGSTEIRVPFTGRSVTAKGDELAWLCSAGEDLEMHGSVYDTAAGSMRHFYQPSGPNPFDGVAISFSRADGGAGPLAPLATQRIAQHLAGNLAHVAAVRVGKGAVLAGIFGQTLKFRDPLPLGEFTNGEFSSDAFLVRVDSGGSRIWGGATGAEGPDGFTALAKTEGGDLLVGGFFTKKMMLGDVELTNMNPFGDAGFFLGRVREDGSAVFARSYVEHEAAFCGGPLLRLSARPGGGASLAMTQHGAIDLGGGLRQPASSNGSCIGDVLVARVDGAGKHLWSSRYGDEYEQRLTDVAVDDAGNTWIAGYSAGTLDFGEGLPPIEAPPGDGASMAIFVAAFDAAGKPFFARNLGTTLANWTMRVHLGPRIGGGAVVAGAFSGRIELGAGAVLESRGSGVDGFVLSLDGAGKTVWAKHLEHGAAQPDKGFFLDDLSVSEDGRAVLVGRANALLSFDGGFVVGTPSRGTLDTPSGMLVALAFGPDGTASGARSLACSYGVAAIDAAEGEAFLVSTTAGHAEEPGGRLLFGSKELWLGRLSLGSP